MIIKKISLIFQNYIIYHILTTNDLCKERLLLFFKLWGKK